MNVPDEILAELEHELLTPIAVIKGYAELLETRGEDEQLRRTAATNIHDAAERMSQTIARLLGDPRS